jgi:hypothetical protein
MFIVCNRQLMAHYATLIVNDSYRFCVRRLGDSYVNTLTRPTATTWAIRKINIWTEFVRNECLDPELQKVKEKTVGHVFFLSCCFHCEWGLSLEFGHLVHSNSRNRSCLNVWYMNRRCRLDNYNPLSSESWFRFIELAQPISIKEKCLLIHRYYEWILQLCILTTSIVFWTNMMSI